MGLQVLKIVLNNSLKSYRPGETVKGQMVLALDSPKKFRGINVIIKGEARTSWSVYLNNQQHRYTGHQEYFSVRKDFAVGLTGEEFEFSSGAHMFPFECILPQNIPSSFESDFGHIRYTIKGTIHRPWKFDLETKDAFSVVSNYDLNADPRASEPVVMEETKTFGCFCTSPPVTVNLSLPVKGYVPGQSIPVTVYIENATGIKVNAVKLTLDKYVTYRATEPRSDTKTERMRVAEACTLTENNGNVIFYQLLKIPPLPSSNLNYCGLIDIHYLLKLKAFVSGSYSSSLKIATLVFIGTIPLNNYQSLVTSSVASRRSEMSLAASSPTTPFPSAPLEFSLALDSPTGYFNLSSLTYQESWIRNSSGRR